MDRSSVGQDMKLQELGATEESTYVDSPSLPKEEHSNNSSSSSVGAVASSGFGDLSSGLREKMSTTRKDSAGDVMVSTPALYRTTCIFTPCTFYRVCRYPSAVGPV